MRSGRGWIGVCSALAWCAVVGQAAWAGEGPAADRRADEGGRLEWIEDLSESLANDLLALSVAMRDRELTEVRRYFSESLAARPLPHIPGPVKTRVKWLGSRRWSAESPRAGTVARDEWLRGWGALLDHFGQIEDARFKVERASFHEDSQLVLGAETPTAAPGAKGEARIAFELRGRNVEGQREWARGQARVEIEKPADGPWQITAFEPLGLESLVASVDLFSEVSVPAGVAARRPPYGSQGSSGFVWHGAAAGDLDNDGWLDLFVTGVDRSTLYLNRGDGRFRDATAEAGLEALASGVAPLLLDFDGDGDRDVFISAVGPQVLLENRLLPDGELTFWDVSVELGVAVQAVGFGTTAADVNGDGRADIYVASYNHYGRVTPDSWFRASNGQPNLLLLSQPDGSFRNGAREWGVEDSRWSYAPAFADLDRDGRPDLYLANDFGENGLFFHRGNRFSEEGAERGVLDPGNGMGVSFGDYDNDGHLDLFVTNMSSTAGNRILSRLFPDAGPQDSVLVKLASGSNLYRNTGQGRFRDVTAEVGPFSGGWAWGGGFLDFDNDGWEDLYTPNGFISGKSMKDT